MERQRIAAVDMARGGGILAVAAAHMGLIGPVAGPWLYSFYMALFFVLAGYVYGHRPAPFAACLPRLRRLAGSYFGACAVLFALWLPLEPLRRGETARIGPALFSILYGRFYDIGGLLPLTDAVWAGQLWFLTALCTGTALFFALRPLAGQQPWRRAAVLAALLLAAQALRGLPVLLPWCADIAPMTAALLLAGAWLGEADWLTAPGPRRDLPLVPALAAFVLLHDVYDLHMRGYGRFTGPAGPVCAFLAGLGGSMLFMRLCQLLSALPPLRGALAALGRRSLDVLLWHSLWAWGARLLAGHLPAPLSAWAGAWPVRWLLLAAVVGLSLATGTLLRQLWALLAARRRTL